MFITILGVGIITIACIATVYFLVFGRMKYIDTCIYIFMV